ncbi:transcriptional coactivator/pterin dehydratase [Xylaria castorea]|nr:transcriptional coactivator/pterin dehydratase [Xylaria castorea]
MSMKIAPSQANTRINLLMSQNWLVNADGTALEAIFHFKTFKKAWEFMGLIAAKAAEQRHHPEWANGYNRVFIRWTTHDVGGISEKDLDMAEACHEHATNLGGVIMENVDGTKLDNDRVALKDLAGRLCT